MKEKLNDLSVSVRLLIVGVLVFSIAYSGIIGVIGRTLWDDSADGSLIEQDGEIVGSQMIGQEFNDPKYFRGRPSSIDYNAMESGSRNLAPNNPKLAERVREDLLRISKTHENNVLSIPSDLVTESGSALDPHITYRSAMLQIPRISSNTGISQVELRSLVKKYTEDPLLGLYGMKRVNVLLLNIEIEKLLKGDNVE